jgi:hypothetical protein
MRASVTGFRDDHLRHVRDINSILERLDADTVEKEAEPEESAVPSTLRQTQRDARSSGLLRLARDRAQQHGDFKREAARTVSSRLVSTLPQRGRCGADG